MKNVIAIANWTLIAAAAYVIWFLGAFLFLGTEETYEKMKAELPNNFFARSAMLLALAGIFSVLLGLVNRVVMIFTKDLDRKYPLKIAGIAFVVCSIAGIIGAIVLFTW